MGLRTPLLWLIFLAWMVAGGVLVSSADGTQRLVGTLLVVALAVGLAALAVVHYFGQRRRAQSKP